MNIQNIPVCITDTMPDILECMVYTSGLSRELTDHSLWPLFIVDRYNLHCWCLLYNLIFFIVY